MDKMGCVPNLKRTIICQRCGKPTPLTRSTKRFCSEYCRKKEEKKDTVSAIKIDADLQDALYNFFKF